MKNCRVHDLPCLDQRSTENGGCAERVGCRNEELENDEYAQYYERWLAA